MKAGRWTLMILCLILLTPMVGRTESKEGMVTSVSQKEQIEAIEQRIHETRKKRERAEKDIFEKTTEIRGDIDRLNKAESGLGGLNGLGVVEQMNVKAERYGLERQSRKLIQRKFVELEKLLLQWRALKEKLVEDTELLELKKTILQLKKTVREESPLEGLSEEDFEYYEVKRPTTLQQISALPSVYGDPSQWKFIYEANRSKIKNPSGEIPKGTTLVIPNIKPKVNFIEEPPKP